MKQPPSTLPELRDITVYHPINADAAHDVEADSTSGRDGQDMKVDWSDFKEYIAEEQWQNVARVLTEMALSEHRDNSVKHQPGSPQGSRS